MLSSLRTRKSGLLRQCIVRIGHRRSRDPGAGVPESRPAALRDRRIDGRRSRSFCCSNGVLKPRAFVGIYPLTNLNWIYNSGTSTINPQAQINSSIQTAYGCTNAATCNPAFVPYDPTQIAATAFTGFPMHLWQSPTDTVVDKSQNADLFASRVNAAGGSVVVTATTGDHGDVSNFNPAAIVTFFNSR